jgi:uncharacterized protein (DUF2062 family)
MTATRGPCHRPRNLYRRFACWLLNNQGSDHDLALGFAIGLFVSLTPTVGIQMVLGAFIAHLFKANRVVAAALAWITNPLTIIPIFYFNYRVGCLFLPGDENAGLELARLASQASWLEPGQLLVILKQLAIDLVDVAAPLWLGSLLVASIAALASYPVVKRIVHAERRHLTRLTQIANNEAEEE